ADGRRMVFHREVEADWLPAQFPEWHSLDPDFRLIRTGIFPSYSPKGDRLICNSEQGAILRNTVLLTMQADGSNRTVVFKDAEKSPIAAVWSPKGDRIAFGLGRFFQMADGKAVADIALMGADGRNLKVLTDGKGNYGFPSWSRDGRRLVYRSSDGK